MFVARLSLETSQDRVVDLQWQIEAGNVKPIRTQIRGVREGALSKAVTLHWAATLETTLRSYACYGKASPLRDHPDTRAVEAWMRATYLDAWMATADEARLVAQTRAWHETYR